MKTTDTIPKKCSSLRVASKYTTLAVALGAWLAGSIALAAPANDNFTDAINLTGVASGQTGDALVGSQTGTNSTDATLESGEPTIAGTTKSVWFKWTCPASGNLTVDTLGSTNPAAGEWDAVLGIYTGSAVNALTPLGGSPQDIVLQEAMTVAVTAGTVYSIQLGGYFDEVAANILLRWNLVPTNGASILSFGPGAVVGSVVSNAASIAWIVPYGSPTAPTFTLSPGATCTIGGLPVTSGSPVNFTGGPVVFTITAQGASPIINNYTVTVSSAPAVLWDTAGDGVWDQVTSNWFTQPGAVTTTFANGNEAIFSDIVGGTVNIAPAGVSPGFTTVNAADGFYIFTGGPIAGNGPLTKSGDSTLTLSTPNTYLGATAVNGGTLTANGTGAVGGSTSFSVATDATLLLSGSTGAKKLWPESAATAATLSGAGTVTVTGSGLFGVGFRFDMSAFTGNLNLNGGQFTVNNALSPGFISPVNGTVNVGSGTCLYLGWNGYVMNATVRLNSGIDNGENLGVLRGSNGTLNGALILGANTKIGADPTLIINAVISDEGNNFGFTTVASGTVTLTATNTYTGTTIVNTGSTLKCDTALSLGSGDLRISGKVNLNYAGTRSVAALTLGGVAQVIGGTYGSTASGATYQSDTYFAGTGTVTVPPSTANNILTFNFGVHGPATIVDDTITIEVLFGTDVTTLAPTYTVSPAASGSPASGATVDFTSPQTYTITAQDLSTKEYTVSVIENPPSSNSDITAFGTNVSGSSAQFVNTGATTGIIIWSVPAGTTVATLAPTYTLSPGATCSRPSGIIPVPPLSTVTSVPYVVTAQDAITTKTYSVIVKVDTPPPVAGYSRWFDASKITGKVNGDPITTWDDLSGNAANATVPVGNAAPVYVANAGTSTGRPAVSFAKNGGANNSGALSFTRNSAIRTVFSVFKGNSFLLTDAVAYDFHRPGNDSPSEPLWVGFTNANIRNGSTYVNGALVNGSSFSMPTGLQNGFNLVEVITTGNVTADSFNKDRTIHAGNQSHAEVIIYDRVLTNAERLSVEAYLTDKWLLTTDAAKITAFGPGATIGDVVDNAAEIFWTVPFGTNLSTLPASFTISSGATCDKVSGSTQDFTNPLVYRVTSFDTLVVNDYTVYVTLGDPSPDSDITAFGPGAIIDQGSQTITMIVPFGTDVAALAPTFTVSPFATCSQVSGVVPTPNFGATNPLTYTVTAQDSVTTKDYIVTVLVAPNESALIWNIAGGGVWDLSTANWLGQTSNTTMPFFRTLPAIFNKTNGGTINIAAGMLPASTTVSAASGTYSFSGSPITTGSLTKTGAGILNLNSPNTYPGGTLISGGRVTLATSIQGGLGTGTVTLNSGGILELSRQDVTNALIIGSGGGTIAGGNSFDDTWLGPVTLNGLLTVDSGTTGSHEIDGNISGTGGITKIGGAYSNGSGMILRGTNTYTGTTNIVGGRAQVTQAAALGSGPLIIGVSGVTVSGTQLNLNYIGTKTVASLTLGGVAQTIPGTYGGAASGANVINALFTGTGTVTVLPSATISVFGTNVIGSNAVISPLVANAATIAYTVPFGTFLPTLAPTFTMSSGATCTQTSGVIPSPNFSTGPVVYSVTSSDSMITNAYTVTAIVAPASTAKTLSNLYFTGGGYAWASDVTGFNLRMVVPSATNVTALAPTFSLPLFATCDFPSGTARDFTTPQTYTVTAQDGSTQAYTVTVQKITTVGSGFYQQKVLASGPVSYWPLNEAALPTAFDIASGLNNITYGGTLTLNQAGLRADGNPSVQFTTAAADPANTRVTMNPSLNPREFTVECWVKPTDTTVQYLVSAQDRLTAPATGRRGFALWRNNGATKYGIQIGTSPTTTQILNSTTDTVVGTTAHVVATYDGTTLRMYVNGVLENSLVAIYEPSGALQPGFTIASRNGTVVAASQMQDVALYTRALSPAEIQNHYQVSYAEWAAANAGNQTSGQDFNNDGVQNGVAYFMGATGIATNPGLNASNMITWPMSASFSGTYEVQTSPDLSAWTNVTPRPLPASGNLNYTLPTGLGKQFVRLLVNPTP